MTEQGEDPLCFFLLFINSVNKQGKMFFIASVMFSIKMLVFYLKCYCVKRNTNYIYCLVEKTLKFDIVGERYFWRQHPQRSKVKLFLLALLTIWSNTTVSVVSHKQGQAESNHC